MLTSSTPITPCLCRCHRHRRHVDVNVIDVMSTSMPTSLTPYIWWSHYHRRHVDVIVISAISTTFILCRDVDVIDTLPRRRRHWHSAATSTSSTLCRDVDVIDAMSTSLSSTPCWRYFHRRHVDVNVIKAMLTSFSLTPCLGHVNHPKTFLGRSFGTIVTH
jgi:hypothetical protein